MPRRSQQVSLRLPCGLVDEIDTIAGKNDLTRNGLIAILLYDYTVTKDDDATSALVKRHTAGEVDENIFS